MLVDFDRMMSEAEAMGLVKVLVFLKEVRNEDVSLLGQWIGIDRDCSGPLLSSSWVKFLLLGILKSVSIVELIEGLRFLDCPLKNGQFVGDLKRIKGISKRYYVYWLSA